VNELYSVPRMLFWDGFESHNTSGWSTTAP
jgi:hypothetical protein